MNGVKGFWQRALAAAISTGALLYLFCYFYIAFTRMSYPFELEWMEGGMVSHVQRILDGKTLYGPPSLEFVPYIYNPLYYYVCAAFAKVMGNGFLPLRLVSIISSMGCFVFISLFVWRRTGSFRASLLAAGLFAALFRAAGSWFDLARVDSLLLLLLLAGAYTFDSPQKILRSFVCPVLLFLAFYTKQSTLIVGVFLSLAALLYRRQREKVLLPMIFGTLVVGVSALMHLLTDGWYTYYVFELPGEHTIRLVSLVDKFLARDLFSCLSIALCFTLVVFLHEKIGRDVFLLGGLLLVSLISRIHSGGYANVLMPAYAGIAMYFGLGADLAFRIYGRHAKTRLLLLAAVVVQFVALFYWPDQQLPSSLNRKQGEELLRIVSRYPGEVYWSDHPWYPVLLGKSTQAQTVAIKDVLRGDGSKEGKEIFTEEFARSIRERRYDAIVLDQAKLPVPVAEFQTHYTLVNSNLTSLYFRPLTGSPRRPIFLYERRSLEEGD